MEKTILYCERAMQGPGRGLRHFKIYHIQMLVIF